MCFGRVGAAEQDAEHGIIEPHDFWQGFEPAGAGVPAAFKDRYPASLPDGRVLNLPIRALGDSGEGIASLILTQCSFAVEDALASVLADRLRLFAPDVVVGVPTLGLPLAHAVAQKLGHSRYVALGTSPKFWYDDALSVGLSSITSPEARKRLFVDPRMLPLLEGRRVCLVDDVISSGRSILAALGLLDKVGVRPVAIGAAMVQTRRWETALAEAHGDLVTRVQSAIASPLLQRSGELWERAD